MRCNPLLIVFLLFCFSSRAGTDPSLKVITPHVSPSLKFTENQGQWDNAILFRSQLDGGGFYLEKDGLTFNFYDKKKYRALHHGGGLNGYKDLNIQCHAYKVHFENCNAGAAVDKQQMGSDYENYFLGNDQSKWKGNVKNYHQVWLRNIYNGIDYEAITSATGIKYNFHVKPGASANAIRLRYEGVNQLRLKNNVLTIKLSINEVTEQKPYVYQMIKGQVVNVKCNYSLADKTLSFVFPDGYDKNYELIIDPLLVFAAQSGSTADNFGMTATYDNSGNLYAGGTVFDFGYPTTLGAYSTGFSISTGGNGTTDIVITKYNSSGSSLLYSTYFGGTQSEIVTSLIVDSNNNLCFYGSTGSSNFPVTTGAYDVTFNGGQYLSFFFNGTTFNNGTDIYLAKFNSTGTSLLASTYLGGSDNDGVNHVNHTSFIGNINGSPVFEYVTDSLQNNYGDQYRGEIQLDPANNIYIASSTRSSDFPIVGGFDNTLGGKQDGVLVKFNSNLTTMIYSSFVGGDSNDAGYGLLVKNNLEVYMTGGTCSGSTFPGSGGYQSSYQGGKADGYVIRVNPGGNVVLNRTFFGTSQFDQSYFIQTDKYDNIYVYGQSLGNMPVVVAPNQTTVFNIPGTHQFISRFDKTLANLNMSTVFGHMTNNTDISPCAFAVDKCLNIYISGWGSDLFGVNPPMSSMPLLQPTQATTDGHDFYFMGLDSNAATLKYGSYFGGATSHEHVDGGTSRFDPRGRIYQSACAGCGGNDDWPVTAGAWPNTPGNPNHSFNCNNGVVKLDFQLQLSVATINTNTLSGCAPLTLTLTNAVPSTNSLSTFIWYLGNGSTTSVITNPVVTYTAPGVYTVALVVRDNLTCNKIDSTINFVTVSPQPANTISLSTNPCSNTVQVSTATGGNLGTNPFTWSFGDGTPSGTLSSVSHTYANNGVYTVTLQVVDVNGCSAIKTTTLSVFNFSAGVANSASICAGSSTTISANGGTSYTWTPGSSLSNTSVASPVANPLVTTVYTVQVLNTTPGYGCSGTLTTQVTVQPKPMAGFNYSGAHCTNVITTTNTSTGNLGANAYSWNFGDTGQPSSVTSPSYTYAGNGTYTLSLTVMDVNGCVDVRTATLSIFNFTPGVVNTASICSGATTNIVALGGTNYTWTPASSLNNGFVGSPVASPTVTTIYTVQIVNNTPGYDCAKTLTTQVLVKPSPVAQFSYSLNPCGGGVYFNDQSGSDVTDWQWYLSPVLTSTAQNPYNFYSNGGTYTVTLVSTNQYGCKNTATKVITVDTPPTVSASGSTSICIGDSVQLHASGGTSYQWLPAESLDFPGMANPVATPTVSTEYSVNITTASTNSVDGKPCQMLLSTMVNVYVLSTIPISAQANPAVITTGSATTLTYLGSPGASVTWYPPGSTSPPNSYTVTAYPNQPTTYTVTAQNGPCMQRVLVHVDAYSEGCLDKDVFIPNTFTPNNDGQNDVLYVRGLKITEVYFAVYNRWGELMFETNDLRKGWDGTYQGKPAEVGVFGWYLKARCFNGDEAFKKGNVTLVR